MALTFLIVPRSSFALTADELRIQISALSAQLEQLKAQLAQIQGQPAQWCHNFDVNLKIGDKSSEITQLKQALIKDGSMSYMALSAEEDFDESTASAVVGFQEKYRDEILTPLGLKHGTGFVGPATRAKLNKLYGCGIIKPSCPQFVSPISGWCKNGKIVSGGYDENGCISPPKCVLSTENLPPVISGVSGPTQLKINETGTWTIKASDPEQGILTYSVVWGDETTGSAFAPTSKSSTYTQTTTFTHSYFKTGIYNPFFTVTDNQGLSAKTSISVNVGENITTPSITVLSPNGGERWEVGNTYQVKWSSINLPADAQNRITIGLILKGTETNLRNFISLIGITTNDGNENITIPSPITPGEYKFQIAYCPSSGGECVVKDNSDNYLNIVASTYSCSDSDSPNGISINPLSPIYLKGTVVDNVGNSYTDYCVDSNTIREYGCSRDSSMAYQDSICSYGCQNGACLSAPSVTVTSPNGGSWQSGTVQTIRWSLNNTNFDRIQLVVGNAVSGVERQLYDQVSQIDYLLNTATSFDWNIPMSILNDLNATSFYIKVNALKADAAGYQVIASAKSSTFTIITQPSITVLSPNGGEAWIAGNTGRISWTNSGLSDSNSVAISLSGYDSNYNMIGRAYLIPQYYAINNQYINWTIPSDIKNNWTPTPSYFKIRVNVLGQSSVYDDSDNYFSIY